MHSLCRSVTPYHIICACRLQAFGRIRHNKLVYFNGDGVALKGRLVMVHIRQCNAFSLFGDMVELLPEGAGGQALGRIREEEAAAARVKEGQLAAV